MNFVRNIIYALLALQEKILRARLGKTLGVTQKSGRKKVFQNGCVLSLDTLADSEKNKMEEELSIILKQLDFEPEKLLDYVAKHGTRVFYIKNPHSLYSIGENEGFIYPQKGFKALYISLLTNSGFRFKTDEMFILSKGQINKFYFVYHFYNWFAFQRKISGMDSESLAILNKFLFNSTEEDFKKLQLSDIYKLKDAIKQDKASIDFVLKLCRELEGAQKAFEKLTDNGASI